MKKVDGTLYFVFSLTRGMTSHLIPTLKITYQHYSYLYDVILAGDLHSLLTVLQSSKDRVTSPVDEWKHKNSGLVTPSCIWACVCDCLHVMRCVFSLCRTWVWTGSAPLHVQSVWAHCSRLTRCCSPQTSGGRTRLSGVWKRRRRRGDEWKKWMSQDLLSSDFVFQPPASFFTPSNTSDSKCLFQNWQHAAILVSRVFEKVNKKHFLETRVAHPVSYKHTVTSEMLDLLCWIQHRGEEEQMARPGQQVWRKTEKNHLHPQTWSFFKKTVKHKRTQSSLKALKTYFISVSSCMWWKSTWTQLIFCQIYNSFGYFI